MDAIDRLWKAARRGTLEDIKAAFAVCSADKRKEAGHEVLLRAAGNTGPDALDILQFLIEQGRRYPHDSGGCLDTHWKDSDGDTAFTCALRCGNLAVADYIFSRDDFRLSDLMPRPVRFPLAIYKTYRTKAIASVSERIDEKGLQYARAVAADIEKTLNAEKPKPAEEDIKALEPIVRKISSSSRDWVSDAQVTSSDFDYMLDEMER